MASNITFGPASAPYTFPAAMAVTQRTQPTTVDEVKIPFLDGTQIPAGTRGSKVITLEGTLGGSGGVDSTGTFITSSALMENELNLMSSFIESGFQLLTLLDITPARAIVCQKTTFTAVPVSGSGRCAYDVTVEFVAPDPRWLATAASTIAPARYINATPALAGSANTFPVITFTGAYANPRIVIFPRNGSPYIALQLAYQMLTGDTVVVDCNPRNRAKGVLLNGSARLDLINFTATVNTVGDSAFFPYLVPGQNNIQVSDGSGVGATGGIPAGATCSVTWNEAYLF